MFETQTIVLIVLWKCALAKDSKCEAKYIGGPQSLPTSVPFLTLRIPTLSL